MNDLIYVRLRLAPRRLLRWLGHLALHQASVLAKHPTPGKNTLYLDTYFSRLYSMPDTYMGNH